MRKPSLLSTLLLIAVLLGACNMPVGSTTPTSDAGQVQTAAAQTVQALQTQIAATAPPPSTPVPSLTPPPEEPTRAPTAAVATLAPLPSLTSAPVNPTASSVCDKASFVADVTIPDGTSFAPGTSFTKTWRLKNDGTCTWSTSYKMVFFSGDSMDGPASAALPNTVNPGQTVDLSVTLKAPVAPKEYTGNWKLENASGVKFGLGSKADQPFWVKITVGATPSSSIFAVTSVQGSANPATYTGACPIELKLTAKITVSKAGRVEYFWERSDGARTTKRSINFTEASTTTVTETIEGVGFAGYSFDGNYRMYIDDPNNQYFGPVKVKITCDP